MNPFLPLIRKLCVTQFLVARPSPVITRDAEKDYSCTVLIPTRNEKGNIEDAFTRTPKLGKWTELIFVDGQSDDGTCEEINRCIEKYGQQWHRVLLLWSDSTTAR